MVSVALRFYPGSVKAVARLSTAVGIANGKVVGDGNASTVDNFVTVGKTA